MAQPPSSGPHRTFSASSSDLNGPSSPITSAPPTSSLLSAATIGQQRGAHQHSLSASGYANSTGQQQHQPAGPQRGVRSSVDAARQLNINTSASNHLGQQGSPLGAGPTPRGIRPSSELLPSGMGGIASPETEAMDRWFNDLQHYEATLEEMAAASLDTNFKEELSAIEQWFRVLSEAERTAALYSLLQSSTPVQIRFFITVLQQMAKADPMGALLSPANPNQSSMEAQMEAKMASLGMKSPSSPAARNFARASVGPDPTTYLSPNSALYDTGDGAAATLASQRAKLKGQAHRISAPGNFSQGSAAEALKSPLWSQQSNDQVAERNARSPSPGPSDGGFSGRGRPKSTGSDLSASNAGGNFLRSGHSSMVLDENGLSPMPGGSWASMVNTPLVPMFKGHDDNDGGAYQNQPSSPNLEMANSRLGWGNSSTTQQQSQQTPSNIVLDDARKFRRTGRVSDGGRPTSGGLGNLPSTAGMGAMGAIGGASSGGGSAANNIGGVSFDQSGNFMFPPGGGQQGRRAVSGPSQPGASRIASAGLAGSGSAQQSAALAAQQNWRNGLLNASNGGSFSANAAQTTFGGGATGGASPNLAAMAAGFGNMTPQDFGNLSMLVQQQQQQLQLQQNLLNLGMGNMALSPMLNASGGAPSSAGLLSPNQMAMAMGANAAAILGGQSPGMGARRSPRTSDRGMGNKPPGPVPGSGANPDEAIDDALLADVSSWLRSLRLHKYTPNFEGTKWQELVMMNEEALEKKGVSALGARRKLLKVFEVVRNQKGMAPPAGLTVPAADLGRAASPSASSAADGSFHDD